MENQITLPNNSKIGHLTVVRTDGRFTICACSCGNLVPTTVKSLVRRGPDSKCWGCRGLKQSWQSKANARHYQIMLSSGEPVAQEWLNGPKRFVSYVNSLKNSKSWGNRRVLSLVRASEPWAPGNVEWKEISK